MNTFTKLFQDYGFTVEETGPNSYIADNGTYCVPFSVHEYRNDWTNWSDISAVSFLSCDKEAIKKHYGNCPNIGYEVFGDWANDRLKKLDVYQCGPIGNHDHCAYEIESALQRITNRTQQPNNLTSSAPNAEDS